MGEGRGEGKTTAPLSDGLNAVPDNRLKTYNGTTYYYDHFGNLIHRELADGEVQNYFYDLHDQLVKAEVFKKDGTKEAWAYTYDALGRRIGKGRLKNKEVSDGLEDETGFVWDGSHLLQEIHPDGRYTYIYTDPDSYEPLAQVHNWTTKDGESCQETHYFHCDQIGIPREMIDKDGNLVWFGNYTGWGRLKEETKVTDSAYQPFRLQNQYADRETGLHYNFFRYYEPDAGRFVNQDPIRLEGGENLYAFAPNTQTWIDFLGLEKILTKGVIYRSGSNSNINLTPRPGKDTTTGLSASLDKQPGKCQAIYVCKLQGSGLEAVNDHGRHVSIRPVNDPNKSKLVEWANTRENASTNPSIYTQKLQQAIPQNNTSSRSYRLVSRGSGRMGCVTCKQGPTHRFTINNLYQ